MKAAEIRDRFLAFFEARRHEVRPSSALIPGDDPTLLFTNAGMVQFKNVFLGREQPENRRAVTAQKCVRAGGKHNDLEQVGETTRHHTFFEMLGNFSFGDYFKEDAVRFAWDFLTEELGLDPERIFVTVHHTDDDAYALWRDAVGVPESRLFRLGDRDNFWQMADTGPCGPCSELHYDLRAPDARTPPDQATFEELGEAGIFIELWNLVFMQFDRDTEGVLHPLPAPSIDTGAGLERLAAVLQEADSNYHTDLFMPLLDRVGEVVGRPYRADGPEGLSFRVLADHARAVAFLLADGVFPSNEGRGYVLRRILRRGVRHAWLLGRREPTLAQVVERVIDTMASAYPELEEGRDHLLRTTRAEEERFLATIEGGLARFDELAPAEGGGGTVGATGTGTGVRVLPGVEVFRLYDTFGFPVDLTELMARERGYEVDVEGFEAALEDQRARSRADRAASDVGGGHEEWLADWDIRIMDVPQRWTGWESRESAGRVAAVRADRGVERVGLVLEENPFYAEAGGQVSDHGVVEGDGWRLSVDDVRKVEGRSAVFGRLDGEIPPGEVRVQATVARGLRHDTERHHTATHLLHAALREVLGAHVTQRGSLVSPDRLRFDFSHPQPMTADELSRVEARVNDAIWEDHPVTWEVVPRDQAMARGAMALFGEKYGEEVRVVDIPGVSLELCGGTHLRHTGEAGLFRIVKEAGVASGVRRIEAVTGRQAFRLMARAEEELEELGALLKVSKDNLRRRAEQLLEERRELEVLLEELRRGGGTGESVIAEAVIEGGGGKKIDYRAVRMPVRDADDARKLGDTFREENFAGVLVVAAEGPEEKVALFVFVTDDLVGGGIRAGDLVRDIAAIAGGRGGGRPHMAQGGVEDPARVQEALEAGAGILARLSGGSVVGGAGP